METLAAAKYEVLKDLQTEIALKEQFARDVLIGLSGTPKRLPSRYFYDEVGSRLFTQITELPEYYLTRCEYEIFETYKEEIAQYVQGDPFYLVELGPGDAFKTQLLIEHFLRKNFDFQYVPIDISEPFMKELLDSLTARFPKLKVRGLVSEYFNALNWLKMLDGRRSFVLFLGSSIGNFNREKTQIFLHSLWNSLNHNDHVLIGFDLKKDIKLLLKAYNDSRGVTRAFNLNLLTRINRELDANFDTSKFMHYATYNVFSGAMESYLVSREKQSVIIERIGQTFSFDPWEPIHTEYSYKYLESDLKKLADGTGFVPEQQYYDSKRYFTDWIWRVQKMEGNGKK